MLNSLVIRSAACAILGTGGLLFAMDAGLIGGPGNAQTQDLGEQTHASDSRPITPHSMTPELPTIVTSSDVRLPMAMEPVAPEAQAIPATFDNMPEVSDEIPTAELSDLGLPCGVTVTATAMPAAMVALDIMAPCRSLASVQIDHSALSFAAQTDAMGLLTLDVPAFASPATFTAIFEDGVEESVVVDLPDLSEFDRIGLSWSGNMGLELHAMEFGAGFGDDGHIWQEAPGHVDATVSGEGGFLTNIAIGDSRAQIYTLPRATLREGESVRLSIDAPITADNCSAQVVARTLRSEASGPVDVTELSFTVPGCDAIGDVLVLQNLLDDLRLASN